MNSSPHKNNSDFQIRHFIAGSCHTPDAAWNVLYEQMLDIQIKLEATKARALRREAKRIELERQKQNIKSELDQLYFEADLLEFNSGEGLNELAIAGAESELKTIKSIMEELEPYRKYSHLPLLEATEAAQRDEWREEFKHRIENYLASQGYIPHDQIEAMRKHPDFENHILPYMKETILKIKSYQESNDDSLNILTYNPTLMITK